MNTVKLSSMSVIPMDHNDLVTCNGGNKAAYDMGHAVGDELRKAFDNALIVIAVWLKF